MAIKQVYAAPTPKLPAWANNGESLRDFDATGKFDTGGPFSSKLKSYQRIADIGNGFNKPIQLNEVTIRGARRLKPITSGIKLVNNSPQAELFTPRTATNLMPSRFESPKIGGSFKPVTVDFSSALSKKGKSNVPGLKGMVPFFSNITNQFSQAPNPPAPGILSPMQLKKVSYANERANLDAMVRGADLGIDRNLDGNTGQAVRASNLATKMKAYGDSYTKESNENADITNRQIQMNTSIEERNLRVTDNFNQQKLEQKIAQQRGRSENLANAADKFMAIQREKDKEKVDLDVAKVYSRLTGGVNANFAEWLKKNGQNSKPFEMKYGGRLKKMY